MKSYYYRRLSRHVFALLFVLAALGANGQFTMARQSMVAPEAGQPGTIYLPMVQRPTGMQSGSRPNVHVTYDTARAVSAEIGPEGGQITTIGADGTRYDLLISPDAVDFTEMVTMTPVLSADGLPLSGGLLGAVGLEPEGLELYKTAFLRIIPPATTPDAHIFGFAYNGTGAHFHFRLLPSGPGESTVQADAKVIGLDLTTLRPVGIGQGTQADVDSIPLTEADLPDPTDYLEELAWRDISRLDDFFREYVWLAVLDSDRSPAKLDEAIRLFEGWLYFVESFHQTETFAAEIADAKRLLAESVEIQGKAASERCFTEKRPEEGFRLLRWMRFARTHISTQAAAALQARLTKCLTFKLTFRSHITENDGGYGYTYTVEAKELILQATVKTRAMGSAPLVWTDFRWTGGGPCQFNTSGIDSTLDLQQGAFGLSISPVSRTSPAVKFDLRYSPGTPAEQTTMLCPDAPAQHWSTTAWKNYFDKMHDYEREGSGYRATVQVIGAGSFTGWVYHHTTTGPGGQAVVEDSEIALEHTPQQ